MDGTRELRHVVTNSGTFKLESQRVYGQRTLAGTETIYQLKADGIYRIGVRSTTKSAAPELVLPGEIHVGFKWRGHSPTSVLETSGQPWDSTFRVQMWVPIDYEISTLNSTAETLAGKYNNCVLVIGEGTSTSVEAPILGPLTVTVKSRAWYAPNTGLVRLERIEGSNANALTAGRVTMQLVSTSP